MSKTKNPCKECPVVNGGHICQDHPEGRKPCSAFARYSLYLAERKIAAMVRTIKTEECSKCYRMDHENCYGCKWYKFTKKGRAR